MYDCFWMNVVAVVDRVQTVSNSLGIKSLSMSKIFRTSLSKTSIAWDYPCCPIHIKQIISLCIYSLVKDDLVLILYLDTYYIALSSIASA
jgi:hypothetical protein